MQTSSNYVIYLATCTEEERKRPSCVKGLIAPDLLKDWYKKYGDLSTVEDVIKIIEDVRSISFI